MATFQVACPSCRTPHDFDGTLSFREECERCAADLHVCVTCRFHDKYVENECRETEADYVSDKQKRNLCEYWKAREGAGASDPAAEAKAKLEALFGGKPAPQPSSADDAKAKLEALFKKK